MHSRHFFAMAAICSVLLACVFPANIAFAHKVNIFAYVEGDRIFVESFFPDGKPVEGGKIVVLSPSGEKLFEGTTGKGGKIDFPIPRAEDLTIQMDASMGHKASYTLKKGELGR
ncbi:MAG: hypothetical protein WAW37_09280 [Syntrophobacteraceae bacterium]